MVQCSIFARVRFQSLQVYHYSVQVFHSVPLRLGVAGYGEGSPCRGGERVAGGLATEALGGPPGVVGRGDIEKALRPAPPVPSPAADSQCAAAPGDAKRAAVGGGRRRRRP